MEDRLKFYRYERIRTHDIPKLLKISFKLNVYYSVKETPKGHWIQQHIPTDGLLSSELIWVAKEGKKRFAYPSKDLALNSAKMRTRKCLLILKNRLDEAESFMTQLDRIRL